MNIIARARGSPPVGEKFAVGGRSGGGNFFQLRGVFGKWGAK